MKKFLSLALALLMMLPLAIGTSAASTTPGTPASPNLGSILDLIEEALKNDFEDDTTASKPDKDACDKNHKHDKDDCKYPSTPSGWTHNCQNCKYENATYYTVNGTTYCKCPKCGSYTPKFGCDCPSSCDVCPLKVGCQICNVCSCDHDDECVRPSKPGYNKTFKHKRSDCELNDIDFSYSYGYVNWLCDNCGAYGRISSKDWDNNWNDYFWNYTVSVVCTKGGEYTMDGSAKVKHGDTRTLKFEADKNYALYDVTVDGVSYGPVPQLTLTVTEDLYVKATFVKLSSLTPAVITTSVTGNGTVKAIKNGQTVSADKFIVNYNDDVTLRFNPASDNYAVKNVIVNGKSMGAIKSYSFAYGIAKDVDIAVTFKWVNPYSDLNSKYLNAVEYVTEAGIMGYFNQSLTKNAFCGTEIISVKNLVAGLAEMADVNEKLDTVADRIAWAEKYGIIDADTDLTAICKVQDACDIVNAFLTVLEDESDVDFDDFDDDDTAKENALSIGLVSKKTYAGNRNLTRYDLASICYLIVNLDVE